MEKDNGLFSPQKFNINTLYYEAQQFSTNSKDASFFFSTTQEARKNNDNDNNATLDFTDLGDLGDLANTDFFTKSYENALNEATTLFLKSGDSIPFATDIPFRSDAGGIYNDSEICVALVTPDTDTLGEQTKVYVPKHYAQLNMWLSLKEFTRPFGPASAIQCDQMRVVTISELEKPSWFTFFPHEFVRQSKRASWWTNAICAIVTGLTQDTQLETLVEQNGDVQYFMQNVMKYSNVKPGEFYQCSVKIDGSTYSGSLSADGVLNFCIAQKLLSPDSINDATIWPPWTSYLLRKTITQIFTSLHVLEFSRTSHDGIADFSINKLVRISSMLELVNVQLGNLIQRMTVVNQDPSKNKGYKCQCGLQIASDSTELYKITVREELADVLAESITSTRLVHVCPSLALINQERGYLYFESVRAHVNSETTQKKKGKKKKRRKKKEKRGESVLNILEERDNLCSKSIMLDLPLNLPDSKTRRLRGSTKRKLGIRGKAPASKRIKCITSTDMLSVTAAYDELMRRMNMV